jgi:hypothetical protein
LFVISQKLKGRLEKVEELSGKRQPKASARVLAMLGALLFLMMFLPVAPTAAAETSQNQTTTMVFIIDNSSYTVNGELIVMDVSPVVIEGRTMLPVRYAAAPLGADISWDDAERKVTVSLENTKIELWIGQSNALINGKTVLIDPENPNVMPLIINGRTMLPIRFVTENLGCDVQWDSVTRKVTITKTGTTTPSGTSTPPVSIEQPGFVKPSVEITKPGVIIPEKEQSEAPIDFQPTDPFDVIDLEESFMPPLDYEKTDPRQTPDTSSWAEDEAGKDAMADNNEESAEKYVVDVTFVYDKYEWRAREKCPPGYQLYNADLNKDAGGAYIYLCYKLGENADDAITDFFMQYSPITRSSATATVSHNTNYVPYTRIGLDLNLGADGDHIYLCYSKAKTKPPVKDMGVAFGNVGWPGYESVCWLNTQEPADVNKSVGGATIIIKYLR